MYKVVDKQLTANFNLLEFFKSPKYLKEINADEVIDGELVQGGLTTDEYDNIVRLASLMQTLRDRLGVPICITSGYRTLAQNNECKGAKKSYHLSGCACDFRCRRNLDAFNILKSDTSLAEVIYHRRQGFIHVAIRRGRGDNKHYVLNSFN